jgi:hypothetical protein
MSHSNTLRLNALRVIASNAVDRDASQRIAIAACLQAEEVDISGTQTPERILKTTKIGSLPVGASTSSNELCIRWLLGTHCIILNYSMYSFHTYSTTQN